MAALSKILRSVGDNGLMFYCPGCQTRHTVYHGEGSGARWQWNNDPKYPTFHPSVLVLSGHHANRRPSENNTCWCSYYKDHPDEPVQFSCQRCHSFIVAGKIQFLDDCSHALAGQTVPLPEWTDDELF